MYPFSLEAFCNQNIVSVSPESWAQVVINQRAPTISLAGSLQGGLCVEIEKIEILLIYRALSRPDRDNWNKAITQELNNLEDMVIWEEFDLPPDAHTIGTTWVFKKKTGQNGELIKFKARLCAQGFSQVEGVDYSDAYAPTGQLSSLRTFLSISAT